MAGRLSKGYGGLRLSKARQEPSNSKTIMNFTTRRLNAVSDDVRVIQELLRRHMWAPIGPASRGSDVDS